MRKRQVRQYEIATFLEPRILVFGRPLRTEHRILAERQYKAVALGPQFCNTPVDMLNCLKGVRKQMT
ncbi:MAG: hypothetical protein GTO63_09230 [Anaerolineae bacterium]|nr:hypothetical protein [Anaerolineae bacterium]NIN95070.1 hypothetical protein [Anaerolineae bacterium]NIQ78109.1 hypothetical protein [Anaerolineae bacterium]